MKQVKIELKEKGQKAINLNIYDYALIRLQNPIKRKKYLSIAPYIQNYKELEFEVTGYSGYISSK